MLAPKADGLAPLPNTAGVGLVVGWAPKADVMEPNAEGALVAPGCGAAVEPKALVDACGAVPPNGLAAFGVGVDAPKANAELAVVVAGAWPKPNTEEAGAGAGLADWPNTAALGVGAALD